MNTKRLRFALLTIPLLAAALTVAADRSKSSGRVIDPTCTSFLPCIEYDNNGAGPAIRGISTGGNGIGGATKFNSTSPANATAGVFGLDQSSSGPFDIGVKGVSTRGTGVVGLSAQSNGIIGNTTFNSTVPLTAAAGVLGNDQSTALPYDMGVEGTSVRGVGIAGISTNGNAVTGASVNFNGVVGQTSFSNTSATTGQAGVLGQDLATPGPFGTPSVNVGVEGTSLYGTGVLGVSSNAIGIEAFSVANTALSAQTNSGTALIAHAKNSGGTAVVAESDHGAAILGNGPLTLNDNSDGNGGIYQVTSKGASWSGAFGNFQVADFVIAGDTGLVVSAGPGVGAYIQNTATPGPNAPPVLALEGGGPYIIAGNSMSLDRQGNMILAGTLTQNGTPLAVHRTSAGARVGAYSTQQTMPSIEDFGEGQLVNGVGYVRISPDFASTIDFRTGYLVFITPEGESRGLYVLSKTSAGFDVRENGGGRSNLLFDYRIVAKPIDTAMARLPAGGRYLSLRPSVGMPISRRYGHAASFTVPVAFPHVRPGYVPTRISHP